MDAQARTVLAEVDRAAPEALETLQALIRIPSTLGQERPAQLLLAERLRALGLAPSLWDVNPDALAGHPGAGYPLLGYGDRPNLTATLPAAGTGGRSLILNGHVDVVSPEPAHLWSRDPWGGTLEAGRVYGRGAGDMKGGICQILLALTALCRSGVTLAAPIEIQFVIEEECTGHGTLACLLGGPTADGVIIPEPRGLTAGVATMGALWFRVTVRGAAGHVQFGAQGNAIEKACELVRTLKQLEVEWNRRPRPSAFADLARPVTLSVGTIQGGDWPSSVPAECTLAARLAFYPGVSVEVVRDEVTATVRAAAEADPWLREHPPEVEFYGLQAEGAEVGLAGAALLETLGECHREVTGQPLRTVAVAACNDTRHYNLYARRPAVTYGPTAANTHGIDEYVEWDSVVLGAKVLALFCLAWAGARSSRAYSFPSC